MQARASGTLYEKESSMMDHLLNAIKISSENLDNSDLRAELKLINPSQSFITCTISDYGPKMKLLVVRSNTTEKPS